MASINPADLFPGYTSDGTNITIPLAALPGLEASEADASTGNGSEVLRIICESAYQAIEGMDQASRPTQITWSKAVPAGLTNDTFRQSYTFGFTIGTNATQLNMAAEP